MMLRTSTALLLVFSVVFVVGCGAAPKVPPSVALVAYDDQPWADVLDAVVVDGNVDYRAFNTPADLPADAPADEVAVAYDTLDGKLDLYLDAIARFGPTSTPDAFPTEEDELAYYLNAYNAIMIRLWLDNGARTASPDAKVQWGWWFTVNQWAVDRQTMSLHHLEQRLIRPEFKESRIHAALICGAVDCPPLRDEPYVGDRLNEQLDDQMRQWFNNPAENAIELRDNGKIYLAAILGWYRDDFRPDGGLDAVVEKYADDDHPHKAAALDALANNRINFQGYDWTINQVPRN